MSFVLSAHCFTISETFRTASILIPAFDDATLTDEQSLLVVASASGIDSISAISPLVQPFSTSAEYPPIKSTPTISATSSNVFAILI